MLQPSSVRLGTRIQPCTAVRRLQGNTRSCNLPSCLILQLFYYPGSILRSLHHRISRGIFHYARFFLFLGRHLPTVAVPSESPINDTALSGVLRIRAAIMHSRVHNFLDDHKESFDAQQKSVRHVVSEAVDDQSSFSQAHAKENDNGRRE